MAEELDILTRYEDAYSARLREYLPRAVKVLASYNSDFMDYEDAVPPIVYLCLPVENYEPSEGTASASQRVRDQWVAYLKIRDFSKRGLPKFTVYPLLKIIKRALRYEDVNGTSSARWTPWTGAGFIDLSSVNLVSVRDAYAQYQISFTLKPRVE